MEQQTSPDEITSTDIGNLIDELVLNVESRLTNAKEVKQMTTAITNKLFPLQHALLIKERRERMR